MNHDHSISREGLRGAVTLAHHFLAERVRPGDCVVDATCGNGNDTLLLARLVGAGGRVWGFDVQQAALDRTAALLDEQGCTGRVELVLKGHENLNELVREPLRAVVFNLGFLPGGEKGCITRSETTLSGLEQAVELLLPGGIVTIALYPGHSGGDDESLAVERWASALPPRTFNVWRHRQLNRSGSAPYLVLVERRG